MKGFIVFLLVIGVLLVLFFLLVFILFYSGEMDLSLTQVRDVSPVIKDITMPDNAGNDFYGT
ncbi:hypothetical protein H1244_004662 [Salmonella enterica]|nr:hypothetical protein [Salmonella enterica]ECU0035130.1 hypothetical protein [Salmonella enterica subsp. enterica serovar Eastbourne]EAR4614439.1 hypothetical protein [Salmonella enterica]EAR7815192.1 hypothetical protein [Salmonella enterica]EDH3357236.1 hypothetical protein [Salmonella enterica]